MPEKKIPQLSVRAQEKEMCRVVELALPNKSHEEQEPTASRRDAECQAPERGSSQMRDGVLPVEETNRWSRLAKLPERDEDVLTMALGTSRSCQSSVLSHVISPLSMTSSTASARKGAHTVREMLTASVRDLQPFRCNGTACRVAPLAGEGPCAGPLRDAEAAARNPKQVVSLQTFKNLARRPTMRKFLHELYTPEISPSPLGAKLNHCSISGKPLGKLPSPGDVDSDDDKAAQRAAKLADAATQDSVCATRLLKRVRQRQMAAEAYESIRRAVAADEHSNRPKLAILSKCDTVVKPRVTLRGGAVWSRTPRCAAWNRAQIDKDSKKTIKHRKTSLFVTRRSGTRSNGSADDKVRECFGKTDAGLLRSRGAISSRAAYKRFRAVVDKPRAAAWFRSVKKLLLGRAERRQNFGPKWLELLT